MPHLPVPDVRDIMVLLDTVQLILLIAVTYLLWWLVRRVYQLYAIGRFWLRSWWSTFEVTDEAAGDRQVPNASIVTPSVHSSDP